MLQTDARDYKPGDRVTTKEGKTGTVTGLVGTRYVTVKIDGSSTHERDRVYIPSHGDIAIIL